MRCPKCGFNLFDRNADGDDVSVRCGYVCYSSPIPEPRKDRRLKAITPKPSGGIEAKAGASR
jgi:hypothetical protein